jgi:hypothetical protein
MEKEIKQAKMLLNIAIFTIVLKYSIIGKYIFEY